jgi:hypothetical protein
MIYEGGKIMFTLTIILVTVLTLILSTALIILAGGAGLIVAFGDLIVCGVIIGLIVRFFRRLR